MLVFMKQRGCMELKKTAEVLAKEIVSKFVEDYDLKTDGHPMQPVFDLEKSVASAIAHERERLNVSDGDLSEMAHDFWQWGKMEDEDRPRFISNSSFKAGFRAAQRILEGE